MIIQGGVRLREECRLEKRRGKETHANSFARIISAPPEGKNDSRSPGNTLFHSSIQSPSDGQSCTGQNSAADCSFGSEFEKQPNPADQGIAARNA